MTEPKTKADKIMQLFPWLLHWTIKDERIGNYRSDAFAIAMDAGLVLIDPLPVAEQLRKDLEKANAIVMTHGNHQRSAWRYRRELAAPVFAPAGATGLDEEPDHWYGEGDELPGELRAIRAEGFQQACYLAFTHPDGPDVLFCGDLICHDEGGPYRFPVQPGYFDPAGGRKDAQRLLQFNLEVMCAAHAVPSLKGCRAALQGAIDRIS
ncbi:MBL fold metallo-hydrolase [Candidatus Neomarinimicrobiota bacterium]